MIFPLSAFVCGARITYSGRYTWATKSSFLGFGEGENTEHKEILECVLYYIDLRPCMMTSFDGKYFRNFSLTITHPPNFLKDGARRCWKYEKETRKRNTIKNLFLYCTNAHKKLEIPKLNVYNCKSIYCAVNEEIRVHNVFPPQVKHIEKNIFFLILFFSRFPYAQTADKIFIFCGSLFLRNYCEKHTGIPFLRKKRYIFFFCFNEVCCIFGQKLVQSNAAGTS